MPLKRRDQQKEKPAGTASAASADPDNASATPHEFISNDVNDEVAAVTLASYNFARISSLSDLTFTKRQRKEIKALLVRMDVLHRNINSFPIYDAIELARAFFYLTYLHSVQNSGVTLELAVNFITKSLNLLYGYEMRPEFFMTAMRVYNQAGYLYLKSKECLIAKNILTEAMKFYMQYMQNNNRAVSVDMKCVLKKEEMFTVPKRLMLLFTTIMTQLITLCNSAAFAKSNKFNVLTYQYTLLLEYLHFKTDHQLMYIYILLSLNFTKSLLKYHRFTEARDHIAVACFVYDSLHDGSHNTSQPLVPAQRKYLSVGINTTWALYAIYLLQASTERLFAHDKGHSIAENGVSMSAPTSDGDDQPILLFHHLEEELRPYTSQIRDTLISDYDGAKEIFASALRYIFKTKKIGNTNTDYMNLILMLVNAIHYFACYESLKTTQTFLFNRQNILLANVYDINSTKSSFMTIRAIAHLKQATSLSVVFDISTESSDLVLVQDQFDCQRRENFMISVAKNSLRYFDYFKRARPQI